jgi:hypothetical protein
MRAIHERRPDLSGATAGVMKDTVDVTRISSLEIDSSQTIPVPASCIAITKTIG